MSPAVQRVRCQDNPWQAQVTVNPEEGSVKCDCNNDFPDVIDLSKCSAYTCVLIFSLFPDAFKKSRISWNEYGWEEEI